MSKKIGQICCLFLMARSNMIFDRGLTPGSATFSVFSLAPPANSVSIGLLTALLKTKVFEVARVIIISAKGLFEVFSIYQFLKYFIWGYFTVIVGKYRKHETQVIRWLLSLLQSLSMLILLTEAQVPTRLGNKCVQFLQLKHYPIVTFFVRPCKKICNTWEGAIPGKMENMFIK